MKKRYQNRIIKIFIVIVSFVLTLSNLTAKETLSPQDLLNLKSCSSAQISPDGEWIAYTVRVPRSVEDEPGGAYSELFLMSLENEVPIPFITGEVNISSIQWKPDGKIISFRMKRGNDAKTQVWGISVNGGEAYQITNSCSGVINYQWHPINDSIAYTSTTPLTKKEKQLKEKGYAFITYEENLKDVNLYQACIHDKCEETPVQLTDGITVWGFQFSPDGKTIAADISEKNLIDHRYMFRKVYLIDVESKKQTLIINNPGKLGNYAFSPDGDKLAYCASLSRSDHQVSQVFSIQIDGSNLKNLTTLNFKGHVSWVNWKNNNIILYRTNEGVNNLLSTVSINGGDRQILLNSKDSGVVFSEPSYTKNFKNFVMIGSSPANPRELYKWSLGSKIKQLTDHNSYLSERKLGEQKLFKYSARDGQPIEGILIYPTDYDSDKLYPLIVTVHGGPEANYSNGWMSGYSTPGQVQAGRGYFVFYPNYRASTGYGIDFANIGLGDPAGVEFEDIADGIDALILKGLVDKDRVGLGGGSYGGYAAAWFSSFYTEKIHAVVMAVGISNLISKRGTTDIPYEELYVHSGRTLEEMWEENLKRSPIYYAHQSKTAVLIVGGADDTRVHPSQSKEYFRRLKMNNHPAVRLIQYPGEGHGNRMQTSQTDMLYRLLEWYDWYVKEAKPFDGSMPPLDISDNYGLELE